MKYTSEIKPMKGRFYTYIYDKEGNKLQFEIFRKRAQAEDFINNWTPTASEWVFEEEKRIEREEKERKATWGENREVYNPLGLTDDDMSRPINMVLIITRKRNLVYTVEVWTRFVNGEKEWDYRNEKLVNASDWEYSQHEVSANRHNGPHGWVTIEKS